LRFSRQGFAVLAVNVSMFDGRFFLDTPEGVAKISLSALKSGNADRLIFRLLAAHISQV
jgi:hypothetical protein